MSEERESVREGGGGGGGGGGGTGKLLFGALGGAFAGLLPRLVTYPLETLKSRSQVRSTLEVKGVDAVVQNKKILNSTATAASARTSTRSILIRTVCETWRTHGVWKGFFPGVHVALLGTIPGSATYFLGYELGKSMYTSDLVQNALQGTSLGSSAGIQGALCGVSAQCVANLMFTPIDITKERMQVQAALLASGRQTKLYTTRELVRKIVREEGIHVFMRGYWKGNMLWMPWSTIYISTYESLKDLELGGGGSSGSSTLELGSCAAAASTIACVLTHPIDVVKTRIQALPSQMWQQQKQQRPPDEQPLVRGTSSSSSSSSTLKMLRDVWTKEGIRGFYSGLHLRILQLSPATVMTWLIYESMQKMMDGTTTST